MFGSPVGGFTAKDLPMLLICLCALLSFLGLLTVSVLMIVPGLHAKGPDHAALPSSSLVISLPLANECPSKKAKVDFLMLQIHPLALRLITRCHVLSTHLLACPSLSCH